MNFLYYSVVFCKLFAIVPTVNLQLHPTTACANANASIYTYKNSNKMQSVGSQFASIFYFVSHPQKLLQVCFACELSGVPCVQIADQK